MVVTTDEIMNAEEFAPRHVDAGYVALSYFVSLIGSLSTLELLQLRTSGRGLYNWYLLFGSSVTMGGIAIWSMHFIGNRATVLYDGQPEFQLTYNTTFTIVSFFVPVVVLLGAYWLAGSGADEVQKVRVGFGGLFAGSSICGMHYLGDKAINNFKPVYNTIHVVASVVIAIVATNVALTLFFVVRKNFTNCWWKRVLLAFLLALAVSGMHWTWVVIIVIALSVFSCVGLLGFALVAGRNRRNQSKKAQRIVLASAIFAEGKLMVLPDGTLPSKTITDTFSERSFEEGFGKRHDVFHWIYRTSRNWRVVVDLLPGMRRHLRSYMEGVRDGQTYFEDYSILFREMFCVAAKDLADATHQPLQSVGVLYEEMLITGLNTGGAGLMSKLDPEIGRRHRGRGKVLFLVKNIDKTEATRLATFGFRFTSPTNVYDVLSRAMQVTKEDVVKVVSTMATYYPEREALLPPGVYLGAFAVQSNEVGGYNILVQQSESSKLPAHSLGINAITPAHFRFLQKYHGKTAGELTTVLRNDLREAASGAGLPEAFARQFNDALAYLLLELKDQIFNNAVLDANPQYLPTAMSEEDPSRPGTGTAAQLIVFKTVVPSHISITSPNLVFTPLPFFSIQQRSYPGCPEHQVHARRVHREFSAKKAVPHTTRTRSRSRSGRIWKSAASQSSSFPAFGRLRAGAPSSRSPSMSSEKNLVVDDPFSAGIMVSQTVTVNVASPTDSTELKDLGPSVNVTKIDDSADNFTWCEALFKGILPDAR